MNNKTFQFLNQSLMVVALSFSTFLAHAENDGGDRPEPSPEIKAALKECAGGKRRDEMTDADRASARACMEGKGFTRPQNREGDRRKPPRNAGSSSG